MSLLARYFFSRCIRYFLLVSSGLTLLFCSIEFFEKMARMPHLSFSNLLYFVCMNCLPTYIASLPVSVWLSSCLLIRDMYLHDEWITIKILGIPERRLFGYVFVAGSLLTFFVCCMHFIGLDRFIHNVESLKYELFKQQPKRYLAHVWLMFDEKHVCYVDQADLENKTVRGLELYRLDDAGNVAEIITFPMALLDFEKGTLFARQTDVLDVALKHSVKQEGITLPLPALCTLLYRKAYPLTFLDQTRLLFFSSQPEDSFWLHGILVEWLRRIAWYAQLIVLPLLTFLLFSLPLSLRWRWGLIMLPYACMVVADNMALWLINHGWLPQSILIPSIVVGLICVLLIFRF